MSAQIPIATVRDYLKGLLDRLTSSLETEDGGARFREDLWERAEGGGGRTRILEGGTVFEKAGVAFSQVRGANLPPSATAHRPELAGRGYEALGVSLVIHPLNPYVPTTHMQCPPLFGDGRGRPSVVVRRRLDLTPYYGFKRMPCTGTGLPARPSVRSGTGAGRSGATNTSG